MRFVMYRSWTKHFYNKLYHNIVEYELHLSHHKIYCISFYLLRYFLASCFSLPRPSLALLFFLPLPSSLLSRSLLLYPIPPTTFLYLFVYRPIFFSFIWFPSPPPSSVSLSSPFAENSQCRWKVNMISFSSIYSIFLPILEINCSIVALNAS